MRFLLLSSLSLFVLCGCPKKDGRADDAATPSTQPSNPPSGDRTPAVAKDHKLYARVEGASFKNACTDDTGCFKGGCSSEVCTAEDGVNSTCEMPVEGWPSQGASCGCVASECIWYKGAGGGGGGGLPGQAQPCPNGQCAEGFKCVEYYGIAGPNGPKFTSCEIECAKEGTVCPNGQLCTTIADGPGRVCRAQGPDQPAKLDEKKQEIR